MGESASKAPPPPPAAATRLERVRVALGEAAIAAKEKAKECALAAKEWVAEHPHQAGAAAGALAVLAVLRAALGGARRRRDKPPTAVVKVDGAAHDLTVAILGAKPRPLVGKLVFAAAVGTVPARARLQYRWLRRKHGKDVCIDGKREPHYCPTEVDVGARLVIVIAHKPKGGKIGAFSELVTEPVGPGDPKRVTSQKTLKQKYVLPKSETTPVGHPLRALDSS